MSQPEPAPATPLVERRRDPDRTRERLLDAAERLFAERGFEGTSLRAVTHAAGTSVSAAHYHFGSKQALLVATVRRNAEPMIEARFARLDALEREAGPVGPLPLEPVLEAFLRPVLEERARGNDAFRRIAARLFSDPPEAVASLKQDVFGATAARFAAALQRALPERTPGDIAIGMQFLVGIMVHVVGGHLDDTPAAGILPNLAGLPDEEVLERVVRFVAAGLRAPTGSPE